MEQNGGGGGGLKKALWDLCRRDGRMVKDGTPIVPVAKRKKWGGECEAIQGCNGRRV